MPKRTCAQASPGVPILPDDEFAAVLSPRAQLLLQVANLLEQGVIQDARRPVLNVLLAESSQLEEFLDSYGARCNKTWCHLRALTAAIKTFSSISYCLRHIRHALPRYRLLSGENGFLADTNAALETLNGVLVGFAAQLLQGARDVGISTPTETVFPAFFTEALPVGALRRDRATRHDTSSRERIVHVATSYLELAAESAFLHPAMDAEGEGYAAFVPDPISEESLRQLEYRFHNLQSLYDTFISDSDTERSDPDLHTLRGHISLVFHLVSAGTLLTHYYERHVLFVPGTRSRRYPALVDSKTLLTLLFDYTISYVSVNLTTARDLCHRMLKRYAKVGRVCVPVPAYRGFHVRPSTLVAKIVKHYGSEVTMHLGNEQYDAGSTLALFRANEEINAQKRHQLAHEIREFGVSEDDVPPEEMIPFVRGIVLHLAEQGKIVIYEQPLPLEDLSPREGESVLEFVQAEIARLLATGTIDIRADLTVEFVGDERVLHDLRILAENGYCEDNYGNNVALPQELRYLGQD